MAELLRVEGLTAGYGQAVVVQGIDLRLEKGHSLALLGRNGTGKTTLLNTLIGATRRHAGRIWLDGQDISEWPSHRRAAAGIGWVPQERNIFKSLTVDENLSAVARPGLWTVARALVLNPKLMLLDEPLEGLAPIMVEELLRSIQRVVRDEGMTAIIVEQNPKQILPITQRALVLDRGTVVHEGESEALLADPRRLERWLSVAQR